MATCWIEVHLNLVKAEVKLACIRKQVSKCMYTPQSMDTGTLVIFELAQGLFWMKNSCWGG